MLKIVYIMIDEVSKIYIEYFKNYVIMIRLKVWH